MKYFNIIVFLFLIPFSQVHAKLYLCPKLPIDIEIGKTYDQYWYAWKEGEELNWFNQKYYRLFPNKYHFQSWTSFTYGKNKIDQRNHLPVIACCETQIQEKKIICLYRNVKENNCVLNKDHAIRYSFICPEKSQYGQKG